MRGCGFDVVTCEVAVIESNKIISCKFNAPV